MNRLFRWKLVIALLLTICSTVLIIINSLMDFEMSHNSSGAFVDVVVPEEYQDFEQMELTIRKIAHVVEYSFLGFSVMILTFCSKQYYYKSFCGYSWFYVLAIAVIDEHIQSFSDRTSSTSDIILDFCGALIGFFIGWLIIKAHEKIKRHSKRKIMAGGEK